MGIGPCRLIHFGLCLILSFVSQANGGFRHLLLFRDGLSRFSSLIGMAYYAYPLLFLEWPIALLLRMRGGLLCYPSLHAVVTRPPSSPSPLFLLFYGLVVIVCAVPSPPFLRPLTTTRKLVTWRYFALTSSSLLPATALPLDIGHIAIILRSYDLRRLFALFLTADGW